MAQLYVLAFPNDKAYVGITSKTTAKRYERHFEAAFLHNRPEALYCAMRKHGVPRVVPVMAGTLDEMKQHEVELIAHFGTFTPHGYNMTKGGDGVWGLRYKFSDEHLRKLSEAHKGKKLSDEQRRALAEANRRRKGRRLCDEHRLKLSESHKGWKPSAETRRRISESLTGKKLSQEHRRKLSEAHKGMKRPGRKLSDEHRRKLSEAWAHRKLDAEARKRMSESQRAAWARRKQAACARVA